jgi:hypothetical protein
MRRRSAASAREFEAETADEAIKKAIAVPQGPPDCTFQPARSSRQPWRPAASDGFALSD